MAAKAMMLAGLVLLLTVSLVIVDGQETSSVSTTSSDGSTSTLSSSSTSLSSSTLLPSSSSSSATTSISSSSTSVTTSTASATTTTTSSAAASSSTAPTSSASSSVTPSSSSSSQAASSSTARSTPKVTGTVRPAPDVKLYLDNDPNDARVAAAVAAGCGLFLVNSVFFVIISVLLRYTVRMERHKMPKTGRRSLTGGAVAFYGGQEVQSAQALFAPSLSATNIVSGASDIQLDARGGKGVYINRGFDSGLGSQASIGADNGMQSPGYDSGYRPIEIKSQGAGGTSRA